MRRSSIVLKHYDNLSYFCGSNNVAHRYNDFTSKQETTGSFRTKGNYKRRLTHDESNEAGSSGLEVHYNIENSNESPVVTTREKSKPGKLRRLVPHLPSLMRKVAAATMVKTYVDNARGWKWLPSRNAIKKEPVLDSVGAGAIPNDISKRTITRVLMSGDYLVPTETTEYDYLMEADKRIKNLRTKDKVLHFRWMANIISR
ncbi:hypothetical protein HAX54_004656 [Datura stramonium]|uniref:Uncharacterized protein n=1 Tax=Datura stramonium TaxID=4076 RepID=A0ABS8T7C2_DATST|nr:hypothetical protein [Datura stramonium]